MRVNSLRRKPKIARQRKYQIRGFLLYIFSFAFLVCVLLLLGCSEGFKFPKLGSSKKPKEVGTVSTEQEKAKLLKQIDKKFENPQAHYELGKLYQADGLTSQAEYHYNIALSFQPTHREAQAAMVKTLLDSGQTGKAGNYADIYISQVAGSATESLKLGMAFQGQQLDDYAMSCYQQAVHLAPTSAKINKQIGYYYLGKGNKELAREYLSRSFDLNSNQPEVAGELGRLGVEVKRPHKTEK